MNAIPEIGAVRQVLVKGRITENLTERGLAHFSPRLELIHDGLVRELAVDISVKSHGYFALAFSGPGSDFALPAVEPVTMRLTVALPDGRSNSAEIELTGADLAPVDESFEIGGVQQTAPIIPAAPITLNCRLDPLPVTLFGTVIADNDPAVPVDGASVVLGALSAVTDSRGAFRLEPLPLIVSGTLQIDKGVASATPEFRPDFTKRTNVAAFSLEL